MNTHSDWRPPTLRTDRLLIRPLTDADAEAVFAYSSNPAVARYTLWDAHDSIADSLHFVGDYARSKYADRHYEPYGITFIERPEWVIGTVGCFWTSRANQCAELGYALAEEFWGRGIIVEAARVVIATVFRETDAERIQAHCMFGNEASRRVLEKLGMTYEGVSRRAVKVRRGFRDVHRYALVRGDVTDG